jgi:flagellar L-ring protein precursor FlgH
MFGILARSALVALSLALGACQTPPKTPAALPMAATPVMPSAPTGSIYQSNFDVRFFEDRKARRIGDVLTVQLLEQTAASNTAGSSINKESKVDLPAPTVFDNLLDGLRTDIKFGRDFGGSGEHEQSNRLSGELTVVVVDVRPNGNLVVSGRKRITLNQGDEYVSLIGEVRPDDVAPDNTIPSSRVAHAEISYSGSGAVADASVVGWLGRFFTSPYFPF